MKKNRPGILLTMLCAPEDRDGLIDLIFSETTTLGVRHRLEERTVLRREHVTVDTAYGPLRIKIATDTNGVRRNFSPEFDDCRAAALARNVSLHDVQLAAVQAFLQQYPD